MHARGISAVEAFLQARYHMYRNVYFHKVTRSAEGLVKLVLRRAKELVFEINPWLLAEGSKAAAPRFEVQRVRVEAQLLQGATDPRPARQPKRSAATRLFWRNSTTSCSTRCRSTA